MGFSDQKPNKASSTGVHDLRRTRQSFKELTNAFSNIKEMYEWASQTEPTHALPPTPPRRENTVDTMISPSTQCPRSIETGATSGTHVSEPFEINHSTDGKIPFSSRVTREERMTGAIIPSKARHAINRDRRRRQTLNKPQVSFEEDQASSGRYPAKNDRGVDQVLDEIQLSLAEIRDKCLQDDPGLSMFDHLSLDDEIDKAIRHHTPGYSAKTSLSFDDELDRTLRAHDAKSSAKPRIKREMDQLPGVDKNAGHSVAEKTRRLDPPHTSVNGRWARDPTSPKPATAKPKNTLLRTKDSEKGRIPDGSANLTHGQPSKKLDRGNDDLLEYVMVKPGVTEGSAYLDGEWLVVDDEDGF